MKKNRFEMIRWIDSGCSTAWQWTEIDELKKKLEELNNEIVSCGQVIIENDKWVGIALSSCEDHKNFVQVQYILKKCIIERKTLKHKE